MPGAIVVSIVMVFFALPTVYLTEGLLWLDLEGVDVSDVRPQLNALMTAFSNRMTDQIGLDHKTAEAITLQGSAIGLGTAAFGHLIGADDNTKFAHAIVVWRHQLALLAKNPPK
jgi:hypothetical protein